MSFKNLSFRTKLTIPLVLIASLALIIALMGIFNVRSLSDVSQKIARHYLPATDYLIEADRDLYQALVAERSMLFVDVADKKFSSLVKMHQENIQQAHDRVGKYAKLLTNNETRPLLEKFFTLHREWKTLTDKVVAHRQSGQADAMELSFNAAASKFNEMRDLIDKLTGITLTESDKVAGESQVTSSASQFMMLGGLAVVILITLITVVFFPGLITKPLHQVIARVNDIAHGEGDLTARLQVARKDELGQLANAFNHFVEKLQSIIGKITGATSQVAAAAEEMSAVTSDTRDSIDEQKRAMDQVVSAVTQMSSTVQEVARNTSDAAEAAIAADGNSNSTLAEMNEAVESMRKMADEVEHAAGVITRLGENSETIGTVLDVIKDIADQTNLLALNAAIEAARAGEQGRGFAVVADEVRTLASRTQESTEEIQSMIEQLQSGAQNAVAVMQAGRSQAQYSLDKVVQAGESINSISSSITLIRDMNHQIATSAEEQTVVTDDINHNMIEIHNTSEKTMNASIQTDSSSQELARLAAELQGLVGTFKV
jgi:methyl-accepting chemotaxis protein